MDLIYIKMNFQCSKIKSNSILKLLKNNEVNKAVSVDNIPGKFLKDGFGIVAMAITQICNYLLSYLAFLTPEN